MSLRPARRIAGVRRTLIREIFDSAPADAINLGLGQPDLPTPPSICAAGRRAIADGRTGYTSTAGDPALRAAVAARYPGQASGPGNVLITVGSQEAMFATCLALVDPGEEVLYPDPAYPAYPAVARLVGARGVPYPLSSANGFRIDPREVEQRITERTRLVIVCEPSNPTGAISRDEDLARLAGTLGERGIPWVSDEIYSEFAYDRTFSSMACHAPGRGLVISGLSKDVSMTGWRIGWIVAPEEMVVRLTAVHQYLVTCASSISQAAALAAFTPEGEAERREHVEIFRHRRRLMAEELGRVPGISFKPPDGAFYYFVDVSEHGASRDLARRLLERRNVVVIPGEAFGERGHGFLRISFAAADDRIRAGIRALAAELAGE